jgi:Ser/Thr protein kinase RdoA (MazF antagonist)
MHLKINKEKLQSEILKHFDYEECLFIQQSRNLVFEMRKNGSREILRLSLAENRTESQILSECEWIKQLANFGCNVCRPVEYKDVIVNRVVLEGNEYLATFWEFANGNRIEHAHLSPRLYKNIGKAMGRFHKATIKLNTQKYDRSIWSESDFYNNQMNQYLSHEDSTIKSIAHELITKMSLHRITSENYGLIHADFHFGNFYVNKNDLSIFDFDNCEYGYFVNDIATALHDCTFTWLRKPNREQDGKEFFFGNKLLEYQNTFLDSFLTGYNEENSIGVNEFKNLHDFHRLREIVVYVHHNEVWNDIKHTKPYCDYLTSDRRQIENGGWEFNVKI